MTFADKLALALVIVARTAAAQPAHAPDNTVAAETLFREGKKLMKEHELAQACEKFEASERLDESIGTLLNLGDCREKSGQLATAWATFLKAASDARTAGDVRRETEGRARATALEPRLSYLTISIPDANRVEGLVIKRDGVIVDPALWNQGVPVDAGTYQISGQAPGHEAWSTNVSVQGEAQKASVEVPRFKQLADLTKAVTVKPAPAPVAPPLEPRDDDDERPAPPPRWTMLRKASVVAAAVGAASVAGGLGFGLESRSLERQANAICPEATCADAHALALNRSAQRDALAGNIMFGVGGAAIAGAVVLWFVGAPHQAERVTLAPVVTHDRIGLAFAHSF
ncbi:MAG: hypothetical protein ACM31C_11165 [Acidobacteriota bacterium]